MQKIPPKITEMPEVLIYNPPKTPIYKMSTTFMPREVGWMRAYPINENGKKSLWVDELVIKEKRRGYGTMFLDFARKLSERFECGGKLKLQAGITIFDPTRPPHPFYRKYGFTSDNKKVLRKVDRAIRYHKTLNYKKTPPIIMYYPPETSSKSCLGGIIKRILAKIHKK